MRTQKVSVDIWKMFCGSCSYLFLAFAAYVFLKLVNGCIWLPSYLKKSHGSIMEKRNHKQNDGMVEGLTENETEDKKNVWKLCMLIMLKTSPCTGFKHEMQICLPAKYLPYFKYCVHRIFVLRIAFIYC